MLDGNRSPASAIVGAMDLAAWPPEIVARALLRLSANLIARLREPLVYGETDADGRRARFLEAVAAVEAVERRSVLPPGERGRALARYRALLGKAAERDPSIAITDDVLGRACDELNAGMNSALAMAEAELERWRREWILLAPRPVIAHAALAPTLPVADAGPRLDECEDLATMVRLFCPPEPYPRIAARRSEPVEAVEPLPREPDGRRLEPMPDNPLAELMQRGFDVVETDAGWDAIRDREGLVHTLSRGHADEDAAWDHLIAFVFGPPSPSNGYPERQPHDKDAVHTP